MNPRMNFLEPRGIDFSAYYTSSMEWVRGNNIYGHGPGFGFRYHPLFAILMAIFILPIAEKSVAYLLWMFLNECLFIICLFFMRKFFDNIGTYLWFCLLLIFFSPYYLEAYRGNSSFIVAVLILIAFYYYLKSNYQLFTIFFITSIIIKPLGLLFLPILLVRKQIKLAGVICAIVFILAFPYFLKNPGEWNRFFDVNFQVIPIEGWNIRGANQGLHCLLVNLGAYLGGISSKQFVSCKPFFIYYSLLLGILPFIFILLSLWQTKILKENIYVCVFLWSATYLLGYKHVWEHNYSFVYLGLLFLYLSKYINKKLIIVCAIGVALPTIKMANLYNMKLPVELVSTTGKFFKISWPLFYIVRVTRNLRPDLQHYRYISIVIHYFTRALCVLILYITCTIKTFRTKVIKSKDNSTELEPALSSIP